MSDIIEAVDHDLNLDSNTNALTVNQLETLRDDLNAIFTKNGLRALNLCEIIPTSSSINIKESYQNDLFDMLFPLYKGNLFHYTSRKIGLQILKDHSLKTCSLAHTAKKEYRWFYKKHKLESLRKRYYSSFFDHKISMYHIAKENYYASFSTNEHNKKLWKYFGDKGRGICFEFENKLNFGAIRSILYNSSPKNNCLLHNSGQQLTLFRDLDTVKGKYERTVVLPGVSQMGVFYLYSKYKPQEEVRFNLNLTKLPENVRQDLNLNYILNKHISYPDTIRLPISENNGLVLKKIHLGPYFPKRKRQQRIDEIISEANTIASNITIV